MQSKGPYAIGTNIKTARSAFLTQRAKIAPGMQSKGPSAIGKNIRLHAMPFYYLFIWRSTEIQKLGFAYVHKDFAESGLY